MGADKGGPGTVWFGEYLLVSSPIAGITFAAAVGTASVIRICNFLSAVDPPRRLNIKYIFQFLLRRCVAVLQGRGYAFASSAEAAFETVLPGKTNVGGPPTDRPEGPSSKFNFPARKANDHKSP